ncbi:Hypothetical MutT/nudix family protein [Mycobacteroides abscessus]|nr:Hypothetical MutT/nudix family protein [Mycobacteroides abscessus]CPY82809.1 Hypothetical MutT/nudix family protein [Mycobacteroides abscessus]CPZ45186.1 Hypothetical MutT/nudix family protein [Mycobacteroides abscessus]
MSDGTSGERERHEFVTLESEPVYMGGILALRRDRVAMPGGRSATREVVEHYGAVAVAAVDEAGRVALVYQYRHPLGHRLWELPAGLLDIAGEDSQRAAARELLEEAGIEAGTWRGWWMPLPRPDSPTRWSGYSWPPGCHTRAGERATTKRPI